MKRDLSPAFVASATAEPKAERSIYWDESLPCFGLQVTRAGHKSFVVQYRVGKRSRRMKIKVLKLGEARKEARAIMGQVARDRDPLAERRQRVAAAENTLQSVCENYFRREGNKLRTAVARERVLKRLVYPTLVCVRLTRLSAPTSCGYSTRSRTRMAQPWPTARWRSCVSCSTGKRVAPMILGRRLSEVCLASSRQN